MTCKLFPVETGPIVVRDVHGAEVLRIPESDSTPTFRDLRLGKAVYWAASQSVPKSLAGADLRGADLSSITLVGVDLDGADLSGANLSNTVLANSSLANSNLSFAKLDDFAAYQTDLSSAVLNTASIARSEFFRCSLIGLDLSSTVIVSGTFRQSTGVIFRCPAPIAAGLAVAIQHDDDTMIQAGAFWGDYQTAFDNWACDPTIGLEERHGRSFVLRSIAEEAVFRGWSIRIDGRRSV